MICTIFATDQMGTFGNRGTLPWRMHPEDMEWFREHTLNQIVVMGRKTWDDPKMPKPLSDRINCVVSSRSIEGYPSVRRLHGDYKKQIQDLQTLFPKKNIFILGGPDLIMDCKDLIDYAYITHRKGSAYSDVRIDLRAFMAMMRITSSRPSTDKMLNFSIYKNIDIFRPVHANIP
jgi:dihydrofolate reductase